MTRYEIRGAVASDEAALLELARELNTVNLPHAPDHIGKLLELTDKSFRAEIADPTLRRYLFVLTDLERGSVPGTSMILAQLGRREAPYIYFDVFSEEKYSRELDRHFHHTVLRIGFSYQGPTEIGGLVVAPAERRSPERLGRLISYVRFLFIGAHRDLFQDELLAELLPPLEPDGKSYLWEALGRRFTNMTYVHADRLSSENKDFIRDLFPHGPVYATLLSSEAQAVIGRVGVQTKGVEKMLRRIGFRYCNRVDPFDGGPHFTARTDDVTLVRKTQRMRVGPTLEAATGELALVGRDLNVAPYFRAVSTPVTVDQGRLRLSTEAARRLDVCQGDEAYFLPLK